MKSIDYRKVSPARLAAAIQAGNERAFAELHRRFFRQMLGFSLRWLEDDEIAQDAVQEAFITLWERKDRIDTDKPIVGLLFKILRYQLLSNLRQTKNRQQHLENLAVFLNTGTAEADEGIREKELQTIIQYIVGNMPVRMREIFILSREHELSYKEIADRLQISEHTVRKQISRGLRKQRQIIDKLFPALVVMGTYGICG